MNPLAAEIVKEKESEMMETCLVCMTETGEPPRCVGEEALRKCHYEVRTAPFTNGSTHINIGGILGAVIPLGWIVCIAYIYSRKMRR